MVTCQDAKSVAEIVYLAAIVPLTIAGLAGNIMIVLLWITEKYHPARLILMTLAISHNVFMCFYHALHHFGSNTLTVLTYAIRAFIVQSCLMLTAVQYVWTFNSHRSPFFTKRRISAALVFVFFWSALLRMLPFLVKGTADDERIGEASADFIGVLIPCFLQPVIVCLLLCKKRSLQQSRTRRTKSLTRPSVVIASRTVAQLQSAVTPEPPKTPQSAETPSRFLTVPTITVTPQAETASVKPSLSTFSLLPLLVKRESSMLRELGNERSLLKATIVISVLPAFVYPVGLIGESYFTLLPNNDRHSAMYVIFNTQLGVAMFINYSYHFFLFLVLLPHFRKSLMLKWSLLRQRLIPERETGQKGGPTILAAERSGRLAEYSSLPLVSSQVTVQTISSECAAWSRDSSITGKTTHSTVTFNPKTETFLVSYPDDSEFTTDSVSAASASNGKDSHISDSSSTDDDTSSSSDSDSVVTPALQGGSESTKENDSVSIQQDDTMATKQNDCVPAEQADTMATKQDDSVSTQQDDTESPKQDDLKLSQQGDPITPKRRSKVTPTRQPMATQARRSRAIPTRQPNTSPKK